MDRKVGERSNRKQLNRASLILVGSVVRVKRRFCGNRPAVAGTPSASARDWSPARSLAEGECEGLDSRIEKLDLKQQRDLRGHGNPHNTTAFGP